MLQYCHLIIIMSWHCGGWLPRELYYCRICHSDNHTNSIMQNGMQSSHILILCPGLRLLCRTKTSIRHRFILHPSSMMIHQPPHCVDYNTCQYHTSQPNHTRQSHQNRVSIVLQSSTVPWSYIHITYIHMYVVHNLIQNSTRTVQYIQYTVQFCIYSPKYCTKTSILYVHRSITTLLSFHFCPIIPRLATPLNISTNTVPYHKVSAIHEFLSPSSTTT